MSAEQPKLTKQREAELAQCLLAMRAASDQFYATAARTGHHQFLEFTGLLNEYIHLCTDALDAGKDFQNTALEARPYHLAYIAEKLGCIYGDTIRPLADHLGKR